MSKANWAALVAVGLGVVACGGKTAGEAVRPADPTVDHARGDDGPPAVCHDVTAEGTPLIVDWKPEERGDLEAAMKQGVAVVHYDCKSLKVLQDCHPAGRYAFLGTTKREQLISLENADDAQANLPLHGASIGGGLSRGSAIDVGLIMIGKTTTPIDGITKSTIGDHCEGATHFVQSATVGAFAMKSATAGDVHIKAAVDVFGASADSSSKKGTENKDGDPSSCNSADIDAPKPPQGCGAPLRVRLLAISEGAGAAPPKEAAIPKDVTCEKGLIVVNGKCTAAPAATSAAPKKVTCDLGDTPAVAEKTCNDGIADCCMTAALYYTLGQDVKQDDAKAAAMYGKACDLNNQEACDYYADSFKVSNPAKATALYQKACDSGVANSCNDLGFMLAKTDVKGSIRAYLRACKAGWAYGCIQAGNGFLKGGGGVAPNQPVATDLFELVCKPGGSDGEACYKAGLGYEASDPVKAKKYLGWACNKIGGYPIACAELKKMK